MDRYETIVAAIRNRKVVMFCGHPVWIDFDGSLIYSEKTIKISGRHNPPIQIIEPIHYDYIVISDAL